MSGEFKQHAPALIDAGYLVVPIMPGQKRPSIKKWEGARLTAADSRKYNGDGLGILTGQGEHPIIGLDVDASNPALVASFVAWCSNTLGLSPERVGAAPRILLPYRVDPDEGAVHKMLSREFFDEADPVKPSGAVNKQRLEVLAHGQQFVAYHTHPDTKEPYQWVDDFGGLLAWPAAELPVVTLVQLQAALAEFDRLAAVCGLSPYKATPSAPPKVERTAVDDTDGSALAAAVGAAPFVGVTLENVESFLIYHSWTDRDEWLRVCQAMHHQFDGSEEAFEVFANWSSQWPDYDRDKVEVEWNSFGRRTEGRPVTFRSIYKEFKARRAAAELEDVKALRVQVLEMIASCQSDIELINVVGPKCGKAAAGDDGVLLSLRAPFMARYKVVHPEHASLSVADARRAMLPEKPLKKSAAAVSGAALAMRVQEAPGAQPLTEFGNTWRMLERYGEALMYVGELESWFSWTGNYWEKHSSNSTIRMLAQSTISALHLEATALPANADKGALDAHAAFMKFCANSQKSAMISGMVAAAQAMDEMLVPVGELDKHAHLFGVANGAVDLRTGALVPPNLDDHITVASEVEYDIDAEAPLWRATIADVFCGDMELAAFFQRVCGYAMLGDPKDDIIVIPFGNGANGKSTVIGAVRSVFGHHARTASSATFLASGAEGGGSPGGCREDVLRLRGSRFVYVTEPDAGSVLKEGLIKSMTGGEAMPARGVHAKATVEVQPTWVTFMPTNHRPTIKGEDHAIWRRIMPIPFLRNFDKDVDAIKDVNRAARLEAESAGILRWCVEGALEYQRVGLKVPEAVRAAKQSYRDDMDVMRDWLDEYCVEGAGQQVAGIDLWEAWDRYIRVGGGPKWIGTQTALGRKLAEKGFEKAKRHGRMYYLGLALKDGGGAGDL
jgi:P4 family phage/plasmid primase-like protien